MKNLKIQKLKENAPKWFFSTRTTGDRLRLTKHQRATIKALVIEVFGSGALVWLFGSRVDDCRRGGDIDLLIETHQMDAMAIERAEIKFQTQL